ncbi:DUF5947 family protein [Kitasatospora viridis]|uniref:Uncharacterized protein n=1 Tax=Kitasatospora viridis TaxID=281105 RepID=A0A561SDR8_9ACTN|nr:DUF5947 family protein [Kitasatospora viridis]TWF73016.1 hypothetical protein FHX73_16167 [Kitasatospora viridis]
MSAPAASGLRRFLTAPAPPVERCELCGLALAGEHRHLVDVERRSLACACPPCTLLLDRDGAGEGRFRAVPQRYLTDPQVQLGAGLWESLGIPVGVAFLLHNSVSGRPLAVYPSPAGPTESDLGPGSWETLEQATALAGLLLPDVEALLLVRVDGEELCALVPVDTAYGLVGQLRQHWHGFDGGPEVRARLREFLAGLRGRAGVAERRPA